MKNLDRHGGQTLADFAPVPKLNQPIQEIDILRKNNAHIIGRNERVGDEAVGAVTRGQPVVTEAYTESVSNAKFHTIFPDKTFDKVRSAHLVGFGRLGGLTIALKPFTGSTSPEDAVNEIIGYEVLKDLGIETYDPIGIFPGKHSDSHVVVTKKRDDLMSLDRAEWVAGRMVKSVSDAEVAEQNTETVIKIAEVMAFMHGNGIFHRDGQLKNYAITPYGNVGVIDTEKLRFLSPDISEQQGPSIAREDIEKLLKSLMLSRDDGREDRIFGVGMLSGMSNQTLRNAYLELILEPYTNKLMQLVVDDDIDADYAQELIDTAQNDFNVKRAHTNWPLCLITNPGQVKSKH